MRKPYRPLIWMFSLFLLASQAQAGGQQIPVFSGTPYEMGHQQGTTFKAEINEIIDAIHENYLSNFLMYYYAVWKAKKMEAYIPADLVEEMKGVSEGAGVNYNDVLIGNTLPDLLMLAGNSAACSTFVAMPERTSSQAMLYGRNLDWHTGMAPLMRSITAPMVFATPGKEPVLAVAIPGMVGVLSGINAQGVTMTLMYSWHEDLQEQGIPQTILYRQILAQAQSADDVVDMFSQSGPRTIAINTMVADGQNAYVIESTANHLAVREPSQNGTLFAANHFEDASLIGNEEPHRDYRWDSLSAWEATSENVSSADVHQTIADTALDNDNMTNVLALFVDYGTKTLTWGSDGAPAANGALHDISFEEVFANVAAGL